MRDEINPIELQEIEAQKEEGEKNVVPVDLNLVGHLSVKVVVNVGTTEIPLNKLFSMKSGEVLKLDESITEPLTLLVDGKVVANGVLVAVDENFGIQITKVAK